VRPGRLAYKLRAGFGCTASMHSRGVRRRRLSHDGRERMRAWLMRRNAGLRATLPWMVLGALVGGLAQWTFGWTPEAFLRAELGDALFHSGVVLRWLAPLVDVGPGLLAGAIAGVTVGELLFEPTDLALTSLFGARPRFLREDL